MELAFSTRQDITLGPRTTSALHRDRFTIAKSDALHQNYKTSTNSVVVSDRSAITAGRRLATATPFDTQAGLMTELVGWFTEQRESHGFTHFAGSASGSAFLSKSIRSVTARAN